MRAIVQRVRKASVSIDGVERGRIGPGLLVFLGIGAEDRESDVDWLSRKIPQLRIFPDAAGLMNRSVLACGGEILVISQFTLFGNLRKGTRPSFNRAAPPEVAIPLYEALLKALEGNLRRSVRSGEFGAPMQVELVNDGPVTLILDSKEKRY